MRCTPLPGFQLHLGRDFPDKEGHVDGPYDFVGLLAVRACDPLRNFFHIAALSHNLGRWSTLIGLPTRPVQTARARRRQLLQIPARLTRTSRQWTLRLPARWPWQTDFTTILDAIRALPAHT